MNKKYYARCFAALSLLASMLACGSAQQRDWDQAKKENTPDSYRSFLLKHPLRQDQDVASIATADGGITIRVKRVLRWERYEGDPPSESGDQSWQCGDGPVSGPLTLQIARTALVVSPEQ